MSKDEIRCLQTALLKKRARASRLGSECSALVKQLQGICDHTQTALHGWEHDNGYGRQTQMTGKRCVFCGWVDLWNNNRFTDPRNIRD